MMEWMAPLRHRRAKLVFLANHQEWEPSMSENRYARQHGTKRLWLARLMDRRPIKVAAVALANKIARMAWAMVRGERFTRPLRQTGKS
jgi:hypothetical protein